MDMSGDMGYSKPDYGSLSENGEAIQLIRIRPSGNVEVDERALDIIASCDMPVGFVTLVGKYRTGKSFLMNKLLSLPNQGVKISIICSLESTHLPQPAQKEFGCGQSRSSMKS